MRYFVSGHRDLTKEEFEEHYVPLIQKVVEEDLYPEFVVGDWEGCDTIFVEYMLHKGYNFWINVFIVNKPRMYPFNEYLLSFEKISLRQRDTYDECDASMTKYSDFDIAWIRPGKENSHTANNIKRRYRL